MKAALTLTTAQIEALPNAPLQVIAAPGVGKAIAVLGIQYAFNLIAGYTLSDSSPITDSSDIATTYGANVLNAIPATLGSFLSSATPRLYVLQGSDE